MRSLSACSLAKNVLYSTTQTVQGKKWDGKRRDENSYAWRGDYIYRKDQAVFGDFSVIISSFLSSKLCVTLFLLLPWKMFSPSSILSVAQQLLATFPRFYSWQFILSASFQPFTPFRETCNYTWQFARGSLTAHSEFDAESTAHIEDTDQLSHMGVQDAASLHIM